MVLIFGGAYQGKLDYALERFGLTTADVHYCNDTDTAMPKGKKIIYEIDKWILALINNDVDVAEKATSLMYENPEAVIICNDISCGIVPVDPILRKWREEAGRAVGQIAQNSTEVIRLFCGIPTVVK